ncbi:MAG: hypothetical protein OHK0046_31840 [Anaerolineae bacterium]
MGLAGQVPSSIAQTNTAWPLERRCLPPATTPADDWAFDGAILIQNRQGLHGLKANAEHAYLAVRLDDHPRFSDDVLGGALSPDGQHYAELRGDAGRSFGGGFLVNAINEIRVHTTDGTQQWYSLDWRLLDLVFISGGRESLIWLDDERFVYARDAEGQGAVVNVLHASVQANVHPSPVDVGHSLYPSSIPGRNITRYNAVMRQYQNWVLTDAATETVIDHEGVLSGAVVWYPDASRFIIAVHDPEDNNSALSILDMTGAPLYENFFTGEFTDNGYDWSPDSRYLAASINGDVHLFDMAAQKIIATCLNDAFTLHWSPDGRHLALLERWAYAPVQVIDLEAWTLTNIGEHEGQIIGWRAD